MSTHFILHFRENEFYNYKHQNTFFRLFPLNTFDSPDPIFTSKEKLFWIRLTFSEINFNVIIDKSTDS